jgi:hypothetical protein
VRWIANKARIAAVYSGSGHGNRCAGHREARRPVMSPAHRPQG